MMNASQHRRILIIDDNPSIHSDFRKILSPPRVDDSALQATAEALFGTVDTGQVLEPFAVSSAYQGEEGVEMIVKAKQAGDPFALAFVDVRMPPGIDGVETIARAWNADPDMHFIICSAYSDYSAQDILKRLGISDRLLLLRKPCDTAEIQLLAAAMYQKWQLGQALTV